MTRLDHPPTRAAVRAERSLLGRLGGGCLRPFGAWADARGRPRSRAAHDATRSTPRSRRTTGAQAAGAGDAPQIVHVEATQPTLPGDRRRPRSALAARIETKLWRTRRRRRLARIRPPGTPDLIVTTAAPAASAGSPTGCRLRSTSPRSRRPRSTSSRRAWPADRIDLDRPRRQWPWLLISSPSAARVCRLSGPCTGPDLGTTALVRSRRGHSPRPAGRRRAAQPGGWGPGRQGPGGLRGPGPRPSMPPSSCRTQPEAAGR